MYGTHPHDFALGTRIARADWSSDFENGSAPFRDRFAFKAGTVR